MSFSILVDLYKMFLHNNWSTLDTVLTPDSEDANCLPAALGDGVKDILAYMALSREIPEKIRREHLPTLAALVDFYQVARAIMVRFASIPKMPIRKEIEKMLRYNAFQELSWAISHMEVEEINGLLEYIVTKTDSIDVRVSLAVICRLYDGQMLSREALLLTLANYC